MQANTTARFARFSKLIGTDGIGPDRAGEPARSALAQSAQTRTSATHTESYHAPSRRSGARCGHAGKRALLASRSRVSRSTSIVVHAATASAQSGRWLQRLLSLAVSRLHVVGSKSLALAIALSRAETRSFDTRCGSRARRELMMKAILDSRMTLCPTQGRVEASWRCFVKLQQHISRICGTTLCSSAQSSE